MQKSLTTAVLIGALFAIRMPCGAATPSLITVYSRAVANGAFPEAGLVRSTFADYAIQLSGPQWSFPGGGPGPQQRRALRYDIRRRVGVGHGVQVVTIGRGLEHTPALRLHRRRRWGESSGGCDLQLAWSDLWHYGTRRGWGLWH